MLDSPTSCLFVLIDFLLEDIVHVFQRPSVRFWDKEICPKQRQETEDGKEYVGTKSGILHQRWCDETLQM